MHQQKIVIICLGSDFRSLAINLASLVFEAAGTLSTVFLRTQTSLMLVSFLQAILRAKVRF